MDKHHAQKKEVLRKAKIYFASGRLEQSVDLFSHAIEHGCDTVDAWMSRGAARMALGNHAMAKEDFTRVLEIDHKNERANYFRGIAAVALGEYEEGIADLTASLKQNNDRGIAHLLRGLAYAELGLESDALLDINSASAFSQAEITSFRKLFGESSQPFKNTKVMLAEENAPWNNLLSAKSASSLLNLLE